MQYNFTDRVRLVLTAARDEAVRLRHDYVGTRAHPLGLLSEKEGVASAALDQAGIDRERLRRRIDESIRAGKAAVRGELPYTSRSKKVLENAMSTAREFNHAYVGTEHLLIGLLRERRALPRRCSSAWASRSSSRSNSLPSCWAWTLLLKCLQDQPQRRARIRRGRRFA